MEQFIGCDAHKKFSVFVAVNEKGQAGEALRVAHDRKLYREFLARLPAHSAIAVEASGSYSWLVDEMERSGHRPKLCNPHEAKRRMGLTNKTDKLDARGLAILLRNGTLPEVDSAERVARSARAASAAHIPGEAAHSRKKSHSRNVISS
jgi:transposase